jgi:DNA modification methylase
MAKEYKNDKHPVWLLSDCMQLSLFKFDDKTKIKTGEHHLNNLTGSEWTLHGKSVQIFDGAITEKRKLHGAAYPLSLAKHFIEIYSKEGDTILDPFAGVGTTLDAANLLKRHSLGVELNLDFIKLFNEGIDIKDGTQNFNYQRAIFHGSALNLGEYIPNNSIDFILTSPPYSNLLNKIRPKFADKDYKNNPYKNQSRTLAKPYSTDIEDLGNLSYEEYLEAMKKIFGSLLFIAKEGAYNVWVVRDYRDLNNHLPYINLHGDLVNVATQVGWKMWDLVIWDQSSQRKLVRLGGNKSRRYYFNIGHSFILVFRKNMKGEKFL